MKSFVIVPEKVRSHGNLVASNTVDRYSMSYKCTVSDEFKLVADSGTETVISISTSSSSVSYGTSFSVSGVLKTASNTPLASKSVKLYADGTLLDTLTTNSSGAYTKTISNAFVGSHSYYAVFEADSTYAGVTSSTVSVTVTKVTSTLSLSAVSSSIVVGQSPQLTGTLSVGSGVTVLITDGDTVLDTVTTGTGGAFSYTGSATSSTGTLTFQAVYEGDETHSDVASSIVSITVSSKPVPSLTLSGASSIVYGETLSVSGVLSYNGTGLVYCSVKLYDGTSLKGIRLTNQQGEYSDSITDLSMGNHTIKAVFEGDSTYANVEATLSVTVTEAPVPEPTTLTLTADKSILSYADSESATLSATLLDENDNPMANKPVSFYKMVGESVVSIGNADTDSNGVATKSYASAGSGDISFYVSYGGSLVSETFVVSDRVYYNATEQNISAPSSSVLINRLSNSLSTSIPSKCEISFDMKCNMKLGVGVGSYANFNASAGMNYSLIGFSENTNRNYHIGYRGTSTSIVKSLSGDTGIYHTYKFIVDNGTVTFYIDGVSQGTATINWLNNYSDFTFGYWTWGSGSANVKNMSIKPL